MRKSMVLIFTLAALVTAFIALQAPVFADQEDTVLMAQDSFTADNGTWLKDYTGGTGFVNGWKAIIDQNLVITELPENWKITNNQLTAQGQTGYNGSLGQYNIDLTRQLSETMDFSKDGEYYIRYSTKVADMGKDCMHLLSFISTANQTKYTAGYADGGDTYGSAPYSNLNNLSTRPLQNNTWYTFMIHISTRASGKDIIQMKAFKDGDETPTFSPNVWDREIRENQSFTISRISFHLQNGTGTAETPYFDEISIYKGSAVKVSQTTDAVDLFPGQTLNVTAPTINTISNHNQTLSYEWYDYTDTTPVLLASGSSYTITDSMIGRLIRAKAVITDTTTSVVSTYWPISKYVRAKADVNSIQISYGSNKVTAKVEIYKSGTTTGSVIPILAKYDSNNALVKVVLGAPIDYSGYWTSSGAFTSVIMNPGTLAPGEYVRFFVWNSLTNALPMPVNKNSYLTTARYPAN